MSKVLTSMFLASFIVLLTGCDSEEKYQNTNVITTVEKYRNAITAIENQYWNQAVLVLNKLPEDYEDVSVLNAYANARLHYSMYDENNNYKSNADALVALESIPTNYEGEFASSINDFKNEVIEMEFNYLKNKLVKFVRNGNESMEEVNEIKEQLSLYVSNEEKEIIDIYSEIFIKKLNTESAIHKLEKIPKEYNGILQKEIEAMRKIFARQQEAIEKTINLSEQKKYEEAWKTIGKINWLFNDPEFKALLSYNIAMDYKVRGDKKKAIEEIMEIPDDYNGVFVDKITKFKELNKSEISEVKSEERRTERLVEKWEAMKEPSIGMSASDVKSSRWGKPMRVNKTTIKYGVREQWVYSGNRYLYLEDGFVTAIQE
ncbi:hypothetical protein [Saccharococcus sp. Marseille-Q5394]|uniref:hypothetical protein n=1 Tax=Saccharococcus sp. Marseille-Q5394 TaxID=2972778 RepID=UPI0021C9415C|nr:hypothetical protein [Saccharococcus sp. Marseille-Q5394]